MVFEVKPENLCPGSGQPFTPDQPEGEGWQDTTHRTGGPKRRVAMGQRGVATCPYCNREVHSSTYKPPYSFLPHAKDVKYPPIWERPDRKKFPDECPGTDKAFVPEPGNEGVHQKVGGRRAFGICPDCGREVASNEYGPPYSFHRHVRASLKKNRRVRH